MALLVNLGIVIVIAIAIIIGIIAFVVRYSKDEEELKDNPIGLNFLANYCDGTAIGVEKEIKTGKGGRKIITLSRRDISPKSLNKLKDIDVIVNRENIITLPKGSWSKEKNINIYLPPTAMDFPESIKNTEFGKMLMLYAQIKDSVRSELDMVKEGSERKSEILKRLGDGELSRKNLITIDELTKDIIKFITQHRDKERFTGYTPPGSPGNI